MPERILCDSEFLEKTFKGILRGGATARMLKGIIRAVLLKIFFLGEILQKIQDDILTLEGIAA